MNSDELRDESQNLEEVQKKFDELEEQIQSVISMCEKNNLIDKFEESNNLVVIPRLDLFGIKNAKTIEVYRIKDLYVYKFLNGVNPIDYIITEEPLFRKNGMLIDYTGAKGLEYSLGGHGCSVSPGKDYLNTGINYNSDDVRISALISSSYGRPNCSLASYKSDSDVVIFDKEGVNYKSLSKNKYCQHDGLGTKINGCSFIDAIEGSMFHNKEFFGMKSILKKVNKIHSRKKGGKNYLKQLLLKLRKKNLEIENTTSKGKGNGR